MQPVVNSDDVVIVLDIGCKLIKQECCSFEENWLLESIIPQHYIKFRILQWNFQNIAVYQPDCFPCFFNCKVSRLKCQDVVNGII